MKICSLRNSFEVNITCLSSGGEISFHGKKCSVKFAFICFQNSSFSVQIGIFSSIQKYMKRDLFDIFFELTGLLEKNTLEVFASDQHKLNEEIFLTQFVSKDIDFPQLWGTNQLQTEILRFCFWKIQCIVWRAFFIFVVLKDVKINN